MTRSKEEQDDSNERTVRMVLEQVLGCDPWFCHEGFEQKYAERYYHIALAERALREGHERYVSVMEEESKAMGEALARAEESLRQSREAEGLARKSAEQLAKALASARHHLSKIKKAALFHVDGLPMGEGDDPPEVQAEYYRNETELRSLCADEDTEVEA